MPIVCAFPSVFRNCSSKSRWDLQGCAQEEQVAWVLAGGKVCATGYSVGSCGLSSWCYCSGLGPLKCEQRCVPLRTARSDVCGPLVVGTGCPVSASGIGIGVCGSRPGAASSSTCSTGKTSLEISSLRSWNPGRSIPVTERWLSCPTAIQTGHVSVQSPCPTDGGTLPSSRLELACQKPA